MTPLHTHTSRLLLKTLLFLGVGLSVSSSWADDGTITVLKQDMTCINWGLTSASAAGTLTTYGLKARCTLVQDGLVPGQGGWNIHSNYQFKLVVQSSYDSASHNAVEQLTYTFDGGSDNANPYGDNSDHVSVTRAPSYIPQPFFAKQSAQCTHDPFPPGNLIPAAQCKNRQIQGSGQGLSTWPFNSSDDKLTWGGGSAPYFVSYAQVDPQVAQGLETQAHNTQVLTAEQHVANPTVTAPTGQQKFYTQDLTIQGLIPAKYKADGQNCCMIEIQKSDDQGGWLPPLPIGGKADIDTKGWVVPFSSFGPIGYGKYRVRISPLKYSPADAMAWSPYVEFGVWPKEVLEVPVIAKPLTGQAFTSSFPMQISIPAAAKQAKVQCCELEFQTLQQGVWKTTQTMTDNRLGTSDGAVDYDPAALNLGTGTSRVHARFLKSVSGEALAWSGWREFGVPQPQVRAAAPTATPTSALPAATSTCGAAPKPPCKK